MRNAVRSVLHDRSGEHCSFILETNTKCSNVKILKWLVLAFTWYSVTIMVGRKGQYELPNFRTPYPLFSLLSRFLIPLSNSCSFSLFLFLDLLVVSLFLVLRCILDGRGRGRNVKKDGNATFDKRGRHFGHRACRVVVFI